MHLGTQRIKFKQILILEESLAILQQSLYVRAAQCTWGWVYQGQPQQQTRQVHGDSEVETEYIQCNSQIHPKALVSDLWKIHTVLTY